MTSRTHRTATSEYAAARNDIARLLDVLGMELDKHQERASADPRNWGLPADLQKVRDDLLWTVAFISGRERSEVEAFLNDAV